MQSQTSSMLINDTYYHYLIDLTASVQLALVGHDVGHNQLFSTRAANSIMGIIVTLFLGAGVQWWKYNHNTHHVTPNSSDHDPDIQVWQPS